ncbi:MAG: dihydropyrimidinase [Defluviitaleaceae bacterium]|nr:dihydropyrimidinase [Defluviitaleaceae bacterium]
MLIKNGIIVTGADTFTGDVLIRNGVITQVGLDLSGEGEEVLDAAGKLVLPGAVDVHTHFDLDVGIATAVDDFYTGTIAAACGGTTSIVDHMAFGPDGCRLDHQVKRYHELADDKAVIDFGFHGVIQHVNEDVLADMQTLIAEGITSYKFYMTYGYKLEDADMMRVMARIKELGLIVSAHPENDGTIAYFKDLFHKTGKLTPEYHAKSRPFQCESDAVNRLLLFSEMLGDVPLYVVHLSNGLGLDYCKQARQRGLRNMFIETCPQYLFLGEELYKNADGLKYVMSPPLRDKRHSDELWRGIELGDVQTIGTDHCPFNYATDKQQGAEDFAKCPNGAPGVEMRLPLMYSEGVAKGRISLNRLVDLCATNPAKLFGMYPKKGTIAPGSDGDIVILDPNAKFTITKKDMHENVDYSPYEGMKLDGRISAVVSRGELIVRDNTFLGAKGRGQFLRRSKPITMI